MFNKFCDNIGIILSKYMEAKMGFEIWLAFGLKIEKMTLFYRLADSFVPDIFNKTLLECISICNRAFNLRIQKGNGLCKCCTDLFSLYTCSYVPSMECKQTVHKPLCVIVTSLAALVL